MGWPTKTNCDTPRPTLGNPASLVPQVYRPPTISPPTVADFYNNAPIAAPAPNPVMSPAPIVAETAVVPCPSPAPQPVCAAAAVSPLVTGDTQTTPATALIILIDPDDPAYDEPWSSAPAVDTPSAVPPYPPACIEENACIETRSSVSSPALSDESQADISRLISAQTVIHPALSTRDSRLVRSFAMYETSREV
jgi:hypothetical protein